MDGAPWVWFAPAGGRRGALVARLREEQGNEIPDSRGRGTLTLYVVVCDPDDEAVSVLTDFARAEDLEALQITGIGGFERARRCLGRLDRSKKEHIPIPVEEQCEVLSLIGDVAEGPDGNPSLNIHVVLGLADGTTRGGHRIAGYVFPTLELTVTESPAELRKVFNSDIGAALIDLDLLET